MSNLTPEDLASARREEAAIAAKHAKAARSQANQKKNEKVYQDAPKSKSGYAFINRQCGIDQEPERFKLPGNMTYAQCQLFENNVKGAPKWVVKVEWSTHPLHEFAKTARFQTESFFNLYVDKEIKRRAKKYLGDDQGNQLADDLSAMRKETNVAEGHPAPSIMFGFNSVRMERRGTKNFGEQNVTLIPTTNSKGEHRAILMFMLDGIEMNVILHDKSQNSKRGEKASKMVGYMQDISSQAEELAIIKTTLEKLRNGKQQTT